MACRRCGKCCRNYAVPLALDEDCVRFLVYHGLILRSRNADGRIELYGESKCSKLQYDRDGRYKGAVYETRPAICRAWVCEEARKGEVT